MGIPQKINPEKVANFSSRKSDRQLTSFHQQSTTDSPAKNHVLPPVFAKTPSKNAGYPAQKKLLQKRSLFGLGFGFSDGNGKFRCGPPALYRALWLGDIGKMGFIRSYVGRSAKQILGRQGIAVVRPMMKFGFDPFADIRRLAGVWNYPLKRIFDVGANDGDTALKALKEFPEAQITSFEPHPSTYAQLIAKIGSNPRFQGVNVALGAQTGEVEMFEYDDSKVNSLTPNAEFAKRFGKKGRCIRVASTTLDTFCSEKSIESIDLLKIDTEGFDLVVLEGCCSMLQRRAIKFIFVEFNDLQPREGVFGGSLMPFDTLLRPHGYRFIASYNDYIGTEGEMFLLANALFALPPSSP
jgi:FkbM family methyltransferase